MESKQNKDTDFVANIDVNKIKKNKAFIKEGIKQIMQKIINENKNKEVIFIMDTDRNAIYNNRDPRKSNAYWMNQMVQNISNELEVTFIDLTDTFENNYKINHRSFSAPDGHWNNYGHFVAAESLIKYLQYLLYLQKF